MRLENLYPNFSTALPPDQLAYVAEYRTKRSEDMLKTPTWPKPKKVTNSKAKQDPLTEKEKVLMTLLGYKKKDIIAMRGLKE